MATYGRFLVVGTPRYAKVVDGTAHLVNDLFGACEMTGETLPLSDLQLLAPVMPRQLFAIGLNYADHAAESGKAVPSEPLMWFKAPGAIIAHEETVELAYLDHRTDFEGELTVVIGKTCREVSETDALDYVFGYTNGQDISDRVIQRGESQWARAKSMDTYAPLGPFIETDLDPTDLTIVTRVNGDVRQRGHTRDMIFPVTKLISFLSRDITLQPGDIIMTGTPPGVGPLHDGDVIETRIGTIPPLRNPVRLRAR